MCNENKIKKGLQNTRSYLGILHLKAEGNTWKESEKLSTDIKTKNHTELDQNKLINGGRKKKKNIQNNGSKQS